MTGQHRAEKPAVHMPEDRDGQQADGAAAPVDPGRPVVDARPDDRSPEERRADVQDVRAELGDTVTELTHRLDVPARVRAGRDDVVVRAQEMLDDRAPAVGRAVRDQPGAVLGALVALPLLLVVWRRRRSGRAGRR